MKEKNPCSYRYKSGPIHAHWHGKPYYFFGDYLNDKYGTRILKLPLNAGFSCPNRDGTTGADGCLFCADDGSASPAASGSLDLPEQIKTAKQSFRRSDRATRYIAYFQAFTNTYGPVKVLKERYDSVLEDREIIGIMIGTRPDCLSDDILDLIAGYQKEGFELWIEIGMQTSHNKSLKFLNRGHTHEQTTDAVLRCSKRSMPVCVHVIIGIPGESWAEIMHTADVISSLPVHGVKIHHLHIIKGTKLDLLYQNGEITPLLFDEYVSTVCDFIERLRTDITVHRLLGDREIGSLSAPAWGMHKGTVLKAIGDEFNRRCTCQGFLVHGE